MVGETAMSARSEILKNVRLAMGKKPGETPTAEYSEAPREDADDESQNPPGSPHRE